MTFVQKYTTVFSEDPIHDCIDSVCTDFFIPSMKIVVRLCVDGPRKNDIFVLEYTEIVKKPYRTTEPETITFTEEQMDMVNRIIEVQQTSKKLFKSFSDTL